MMLNKVFAWSINTLCVSYLLWKIAAINSDKAVLLFFAYYPVILFLNLATWFALWVFGNKTYRVYQFTSIALLLLAVPLCWIAGSL
ncbi:MAG: hypothetical protein IPP72_19865 [Chitinophagaceae bacterium]|nr:hypothetical protein [Chitinophagaceae bacterium]